MLIDAIFRSNSLENPAVPITVEAAENDGIFNCDVIVNPRTAMKLAAVYACIGGHEHTMYIGPHGHVVIVDADGNAETTVKNIAFNYIVRLA
ncbi:hypothetical protein ABVL33_004490 [Salmonella enterica]|nr:hypothetical protein [Salmonella enterica subsp. enterica serovar Bonariensis]EHZ1492793.1 hypothetical protein [Salmonella enterica]EKQ1436160.1 hypothetical protein [Salmonella enterica]